MPAPKLGMRQMSFQSNTSSPTPPIHRSIRRQLSDNDFLSLRIGPEKSEGKRSNQRPKPTSRLAWTEPPSEKETAAVEVVARRCAGLPRPVRPPPKDPSDLLAPTRQQLAERLRRAWRGRGCRTNLDIYLAHSRPESSLSTRTAASDDNDIHIIATKAVRAIHRPVTAESKPINETPTKTLQERNKIEINLGVDDTEGSVDKELFQVRTMAFTKQDSFNKENVDDRRKMSASERRASFKTSQLLNRTITGSFSDEGDQDLDDGLKVFLTRPPLLRTSSAPTERNPPTTTQVLPKTTKPIGLDRKTNVDNEFAGQEDYERNQEKPSTRRKIKPCATRRKPKDPEDSSEEEIEVKSTETKKPAPRRRQIPRPGAEIITMVSLVSPAESDAEESPVLTTGLVVNIEPEKSEVETQPEPTAQPSASFILQNLRKTIKTVSFQAHPPVSRSCSASFPLRRVPPGAPIIIPVPITVPTAVQDGRGIKRRLIRAKTAPNPKEEETTLAEDAGQPDTPVNTPTDVKLTKGGGDENDDDDDPDSSGLEPIIKSPKEKECWVLYKKMVDKGVSVSYDTILRGMLTPTEYRLRQNQLSRR